MQYLRRTVTRGVPWVTRCGVGHRRSSPCGGRVAPPESTEPGNVERCGRWRARGSRGSDPGGQQGADASGDDGTHRLGCEIETALGEVLAHVRGETGLSCRIVDDPAASRIVALRKRLRLSRQKFADRFGLDVRAVQEWEQGRRVPDRAARVLLTVIDRDPEAVVRALGEDGGDGRPGDSSAL